MTALPGDNRTALGLCAMCGDSDPEFRTFGRAHRWTAERIDLIEHFYCFNCIAWGQFEAAVCHRRFERRPARSVSVRRAA